MQLFFKIIHKKTNKIIKICSYKIPYFHNNSQKPILRTIDY